MCPQWAVRSVQPFVVSQGERGKCTALTLKGCGNKYCAVGEGQIMKFSEFKEFNEFRDMT